MAAVKARLGILLAAGALGALLVVPAASPQTSALKFKATFSAPTHNPHVGAAWRYRLTATNLVGTDITVTAKQEVRTARGLKVDVIGWKSFSGKYSHTYRWPAVDRGKDLVFTVRVLGPGGTKIFKYKIRVL
jgi:uncharacterized protein (DUF58 family)